jgi:hypothetical protein
MSRKLLLVSVVTNPLVWVVVVLGVAVAAFALLVTAWAYIAREVYRFVHSEVWGAVSTPVQNLTNPSEIVVHWHVDPDTLGEPVVEVLGAEAPQLVEAPTVNVVRPVFGVELPKSKRIRKPKAESVEAVAAQTKKPARKVTRTPAKPKAGGKKSPSTRKSPRAKG